MISWGIDDSNGLDPLELTLHQWVRFLDPEPGERLEIVRFASRGAAAVAFATSLENLIRLARDADARQGSAGVYCIANRVSDAFTHAREPDKWLSSTTGLASNTDIVFRRVFYIDVDSERISGTNASSEEKACAFRLGERVEHALYEWLVVERLPTDAIGCGSSGNGMSVFLALEPAQSEQSVTESVSRILRALARSLQEPGALIDTKVSNPNRLVPLFGTMKRKGEASRERPHRQTTFCCRNPVHRIPLGRVAP